MPARKEKTMKDLRCCLTPLPAEVNHSSCGEIYALLVEEAINVKIMTRSRTLTALRIDRHRVIWVFGGREGGE